MKTFWSRAKAYPPAACRLLARTEGRHPRVLEDSEIAQRGGLAIDVVHALQWQTTWDGIGLDTMRRFLVGCGMDFDNSAQMRRADQYARKRLLARMSYLKHHKEWFTKWKPMKDKWLNAISTLSH